MKNNLSSDKIILQFGKNGNKIRGGKVIPHLLFYLNPRSL